MSGRFVGPLGGGLPPPEFPDQGEPHVYRGHAGRHLQAIHEGVHAIMQDDVPESVFLTPDGPLRGLEPIRAFFHGFLTSSPPELLGAMTLVRKDVQGDDAYIVWKAEPYIQLATDTFVIRDGKVLVQSFATFAAT